MESRNFRNHRVERKTIIPEKVERNSRLHAKRDLNEHLINEINI